MHFSSPGVNHTALLPMKQSCSPIPKNGSERSLGGGEVRRSDLRRSINLATSADKDLDAAPCAMTRCELSPDFMVWEHWAPALPLKGELKRC